MAKNVDSLIAQVKTNEEPVKKAKIVFEIINHYLLQDDMVTCQEWVNHLKYIQSDDQDLIYQKESVQCEVLYFGSLQNLALTHINNGLQFALNNKDSLAIADAFGYKSYIYEDLDSIVEAKKYAELALQFFPTQKGSPRLRELLDKGQIVNQLAQMCVKLKLFSEAKTYNQQSRVLSQQEDNIRSYIMSLATEGNIYFGIGKKDSAYTYFEKAYILAKEKDRRDISLWMMGRMIESGNNKNQKTAFFEEGMKLIEENKVASLYSLLFLKDVQSYFQKLNNLPKSLQLQNKIIELERSNHKHGVKMAQNLSGKYINYEQQITKLTKDQNQKDKVINRYQLLIVIGVLGSIIGFLYWYNKNKKAQLRKDLYKQKEIQKERSSIAREMHDELGGNLSRMQFVLHELKEKAPEEKRLLNNMMGLYDASVENMNDIIWSLQQEFNSLEELQVYCKQFINNWNEKHNGHIQFETKFLDQTIFVPTLIRRNIYLILKELIVSVLSNKTPMQVQLNYKDQRIHLLINSENSLKDVIASSSIQKANKYASEMHTEIQWAKHKMGMEVLVKTD